MKLFVKLIGAAALVVIAFTGCELLEKTKTDTHTQNTEQHAGGAPNQQDSGSSDSQGSGESGGTPPAQDSGGSSGGDSTLQQDSGYDTYKSVEEFKLNFDHAMAGNLTPAEYAEWANANPAQAVTSLKLKLEKSTDSNQHKTVVFGQKNDGYTLEVKFKAESKNNTHSIKVIPMCKRPDNTSVGGESLLASALTQPYFTQKQALNYILAQVKAKPDFCKCDSSKFASELYVLAQTGGQGTTPQGLFNESLLAAYKTAYNRPDGHLQITDIGPYIYSKQITADDCAGSLDFGYVIASPNDITAPNTNADKMSDPESKTLTGFEKIDEVRAKALFEFAVVQGTGAASSAEKLAAWKNKFTRNNGGLEHLLYEEGNPGTTGWSVKKAAAVADKFKSDANQNGYYITLNSVDIGSETSLGESGSGHWLSVGDTDKKLLVKQVAFSKKGGDENLRISMTFCNGSSGRTFTWEVPPTKKD